MKKILVLLIVSVCAAASLSADVEFVFGGIDQHSEVLGGFLPTYASLGAGFNGLSLIDGHTTQLDLLVGGGYSQRKVWQDPQTGEVIRTNPLIWDTVRLDWTVRLSQGFFDSTVDGKDLVTLSVGYTGRYDRNIDSFRTGSMRDNNGDDVIDSLDDYLGGSDYQGAVYPDLRGDRQHLGTAFTAAVLIDMMDDQKMYSNGFEASAEALWAPLALNNALDGIADYYSLTFNAVGSWSPYSFVEDGNHLFSITLIDRFNVNWTDGDEVPVYAQYPVSLGRKVRGYNSWTYNTQFTVVNNFDVRLAGPDWHAIFPRINLFFDAGWGTGNYFNTDLKGDNFLMSTGIQVTVSFFDFIDLGYQVAYLFRGDKFTDGPDVNITGSFTFFLDF